MRVCVFPFLMNYFYDIFQVFRHLILIYYIFFSRVDLVQTSFKCFKLIVTDYLSTLLPNCYPACIETAACFGHQKQDLNIALTAIGSIVSWMDFLFFFLFT